MTQKTTMYLVLMIMLSACQNDRQQKHLTHQKNKTMTTTDFTTTIVVEQTPQEVFNAVNNVSGWWSEEIEGSTDKLNAVFDYHFEDVHRSKMKIIEFVPNQKVT